MGSRYDDELWELVPAEPGLPAPHLVELVRSLRPVERALDLGCGDGRLGAEIRADSLTAADVSATAIRRARPRLVDANLVELTPDEPLPFADGSFDLVVCTETLEHVRDVQLFLSEARRVLGPGGELALSTPAHGRRTALRMLTSGIERELDPLSPHLRLFSARSLRRLLESLGFEVVELRRVSGSLLARGTPSRPLGVR